MNEITSQQNPKFKLAMRLHSSRGRKQQGRFLVFGARESLRAVQSEALVEELFVSESNINDAQIKDLLDRVSIANVYSLPSEMMKKLEFGDRQEGVALIARRPSTQLEELKLEKRSLTLVVEAIEKPGNLGAILRSADGAGIDTIISADPSTDFFHPNCIRASLGTVFAMQLGSAPTSEVQSYLIQNGFSAFAAVVGAEQCYSDADYCRDRVALVFGNEARGLSERWQSEEWNPVFVPMHGIADSLNVSVSMAVIAYEASTQRRKVMK